MEFLIALFFDTTAPVVHPSEFKTGKSWTWDYRDAHDKKYSTERYTVIEVQGTNVTFEMATEFPGKPGFVAHHRFEADVAKCVSANKTWRLRMWYLNGTRWEEYSNPKTLPFEEKFNCLPEAISDKENMFGRLVQTMEGGSWYTYDGVAFQKEFDGGYTFQRR